MTDIVERLTRGDIHQAGHDLIARCFGDTSVVIASIPARPDVDADLVLMGGLMKAAAEIERLRDVGAAYMRAADRVTARAEKAEAEIARLTAIPGLADVLDGKAVIVPVPVDDAMVSAGTYTLADHLCASEYVNGPDASVVLALAHKGFVSALDAAIAASPYWKEPEA